MSSICQRRLETWIFFGPEVRWIIGMLFLYKLLCILTIGFIQSMRWLIQDCKIIERTVTELLSWEWVLCSLNATLRWLALYEDFPEQATLILNYLQYFLSFAFFLFPFKSQSIKSLTLLVVVDSSGSAAGLYCCLTLGSPRFYYETLLSSLD